jgi:hypothetical protein
VPLARDLHPEFGYVGSAPRLFRRIGLVLSFMVFGLVAGASGVAVFMANPDPDPDPMHAMALAPAEALISATRVPPTATVETKAPQLPLAPKTTNAGAVKSPCREGTAEFSGGDCAPVRAVRPRPVLAANERPAIAAVPIGHRDDPAVLPSLPETPVAATPAIPEAPARPEVAALPVEAAPAADAPPAPAVVARKKARTTRSKEAQVQAPHRRERDDDARRYSHNTEGSYHNTEGYARAW